jgi:UDP-3-O-[3-hydroxymyristoyl] glucosamine N-acyltransferase
MKHEQPKLTTHFLKQLPQELIQNHLFFRDLEVETVVIPENLNTVSDEVARKALIFVSSLSDLNKACEKKFAVVIASDSLTDKLKSNLESSSQSKIESNIYLTPSLSISMSFILPRLKKIDCDWGTDIHPTAVIHPNAVIEENARIGPLCVVEDGAYIGHHTHLIGNVFVGAQARVEDYTRIHSGVHIGDRCVVGKNCEIFSNSTIGSDGFGFATLPDKTHKKIPHLGVVVIEDHVEIGANCSIDRGTLFETRIKTGAKFDNLCHVAHNCTIGENSRVAAGFMTAGSTKVGKNFLASGSVILNDHIEIADNVTLAGRTAATTDIKTAGVYGGFPAVPYNEFVKFLSSQSALPELRKKVSRIMKHLNLNND